jgi:hypothetical protein
VHCRICCRRRPKGRTEYENVLDQLATHESKKKTLEKLRHKDLKAKSVASTLERVGQNNFFVCQLDEKKTLEK